MTLNTSPFGLAGKKGLILGLANEHSIAWGCTQMAHAMGAEVVVSCLNEKARRFVEPLTAPIGVDLIACDVEQEGELENLVAKAIERLGHLDFVVHSIAWAPLADLHGQGIDRSSAGFARAMTVSCHSFAQLAKLCAPHMPNGGSMLSMTYLGADEAVPNYGVMGPVKAALESSVRYLASELGPQGIRVNAISPGPLATRAASGIQHFDQLLADAAQRAPLRRLVSIDDVGALSTFMASDASRSMTGSTLYVDAGFHILG